MPQYILGIESSCDETAAAVVADGRHLLANVIASSAPIHRLYGGVVPEIASREHLQAIVPVIQEAMQTAKLEPHQLTGIAVCSGPGLLGSLIVGVAAAKALAAAWQKPLLAVHHLAAHVAANYLSGDLTPPFLALIVSGAHSHIVEVRSYTDFTILARTLDDAPGEAYDKISREIGLDYPGGPKLDKLSYQGDPQKLILPVSHVKDSPDFSFSGVKTAALNALNQAGQQAKQRGLPREAILSNADLAASFQAAIVETLVQKLKFFLEQKSYSTLVLAGGVSANSGLRSACEVLAEEYHVRLSMPPLQFCTDNAAMTAAQGFYEWQAGHTAELDLSASAMWELGEVMPTSRSTD